MVTGAGMIAALRSSRDIAAPNAAKANAVNMSGVKPDIQGPHRCGPRYFSINQPATG